MKSTSRPFRAANPAPPQADALNAMLGKMIGDLGAAANGALVLLGEVVRQGGFTRFRRATETPVNMVLEARP